MSLEDLEWRYSLNDHALDLDGISIKHFDRDSLWICRPDGEGMQVKADKFKKMLIDWYESDF